MPYNKHNVRVNVPQRSGFDKSHRNSGTMTCGTLTPILCDEVIPNSRVSLRLNLATQLPPLVSDTYMNVRMKAEAFFVPMRLLCGSFEDFFCDVAQDLITRNSENQLLRSSERFIVPHLHLNMEDASTVMITRDFGPGSLADYLGCGISAENVSIDNQNFDINILPFVAYHLIWQEWYRNPRVQRPAFVDLRYSLGVSPIASMPYTKYLDSDVYNYNTNALTPASNGSFRYAGLLLNDYTSIFALRQRNFPLDYFTGARLTAQQGDPAAVTIQIPATEDQTSFTIAQLRAANSLQQFRERNNLPSSRLVDQVKARYGAILSDGVAQRPICIGSASYDVSSTGVSQTAAGEGDNPFSSVAAQYGRAYGSGSDFIISDFTANEPGYVMVLISLVPEVTYSGIIDRKFLRYIAPGSITEMANPFLQNVGDQPIYAYELTSLLASDYGYQVFGYQDRYADFMFIPNQAHGLFREGQSLASFVLQRSYRAGEGAAPGDVVLSDEFLQIPTDYLDGVFAASTGVSGVSAWFDCYLDYKVSMPLAEFSIPSLQDPAYEHGHSVSLRRNGQIF